MPEPHTQIIVERGLAPHHFQGEGCAACTDGVLADTPVGVYAHDDHPGAKPSPTGQHEHFICTPCLAGGAPTIRRGMLQQAAELRAQADWRTRRADALAADPTLRDAAQYEGTLADKLALDAAQLETEAAADWRLPTLLVVAATGNRHI